MNHPARLTRSLLCAAVVLGSMSAKADDLSVKDWTVQLKTALQQKKFFDVKRLTDLTTLNEHLFKTRKPADEKALAKAREFYAQGKMKEAIEEYDLVGKDSDAWLDAVEEKGWAYLKSGQTDKALAQTKTLLSDTFLSITGSTPFFLQSLTDLKACDYKGVLETHQLFKATQKDRMIQVQELAKKGASQAFVQAVRKADRFPLAFKDFGDEVKNLPKGFYRDVPLQKALLHVKLANEGLPMLKAAGGDRQTAPAVIEAIQHLERKLVEDRALVKTRMKTLAQLETDENFKTVQKLNLIEVETIQRIHIDREIDQKTYAKGKFTDISANQLVFPDDGHPWVDELDRYQVKLNSCPQNIRRRM